MEGLQFEVMIVTAGHHTAFKWMGKFLVDGIMESIDVDMLCQVGLTPGNDENAVPALSMRQGHLSESSVWIKLPCHLHISKLETHENLHPKS